MHDDITKANHLAHDVCELRRQPVVLLQQIEQLTMSLWLAESPIRHNMGGNIQSGLDGDLQGIGDKAFLTDIVRDALWLTELARHAVGLMAF